VEKVMRSRTSSFKRLRCEVCNASALTSVARIDDNEFALALPPDWRLIWNKLERSLQFMCDICWETFELTLEPDGNLS
jgi:hypothetical protein